MNKYALIVAGGSGNRMNSGIPKQFIEINNKPILMHTIENFHKYDKDISILVVLPENQFQFWGDLCEKHKFNIKITLVEGGSTRFQSVKNGLNIIHREGVVAIHDGVRPFVTNRIISENYITAYQKGAALTVVDLKDSIRTKDKAVNRSDFKQVQTPQTFKVKDIKKAYNQNESSFFTDDASVYEKFGGVITFVDGDYKNIKITTPEDILVGEVLAKL